jgi:CubicO group peptidase (beta-lactamase class C family)
LRADVTAFAQRVVDPGFTPGMSVSVAIGDRVAYAEGFGFADMSTGRRATGDTPFYIASTSKSLTALATLLAAREGKLDLRAPMVRYLPSARLADGVDRNAITVHDLIALTHGLSGNGPVVLRTAYTGEFTRDQLLELLRFHAATGEKGTFNYNNLGYNLAGLVLESVYDDPWQDVVGRMVTEPLGMTRTSARVSDFGQDAVALPHDYTPAGFERMELGKDDANMHAAGGHFASARDMARYLAAHTSGGLLDGRRVFPEDAVRATHVQRVAQNRTFGPYHRHGWGYGWDLGTFEGDTIVHRFGGFSGYRSHASFMPAHDVGVAVLVNGDGPASAAADLVATYVYDRLTGKPGIESRFAARLDSLRQLAARQRQAVGADRERRRSRLAPLPHALDRYAGTYVSPRLGTMDWRVVADGLELRMGVATSRAEVYNAAENQLRVEIAGGGQVATFEFASGGGPARAVTLAGERFERRF